MATSQKAPETNKAGESKETGTPAPQEPIEQPAQTAESAKEEVKQLIKDAVAEVVGDLTPENKFINAKIPAAALERNPDTVYVRRGENERNQFSKSEWEALGENKAGWVEEVEVPAEVKALQENK